MDVDDILLNDLRQMSLIDTEPLSTTLLTDNDDDTDDLVNYDDHMAYDGGSEPDVLDDLDDYGNGYDMANDHEMYFEIEYAG